MFQAIGAANLTSLELLAVNFKGANLEGIKYDETTLMQLVNSNHKKVKISPDLPNHIKNFDQGEATLILYEE